MVLVSNVLISLSRKILSALPGLSPFVLSQMDGEVGISFDAMIRVCTKLAKTIEKENVERIFDTADQFKKLASDAGPLVESVEKILRDISPILKDLAEVECVSLID